MKITIVGRQMNVWDSTKEMAEKKLAKLDKYFGSEAMVFMEIYCVLIQTTIMLSSTKTHHSMWVY